MTSRRKRRNTAARLAPGLALLLLPCAAPGQQPQTSGQAVVITRDGTIAVGRIQAKILQDGDPSITLLVEDHPAPEQLLNRYVDRYLAKKRAQDAPARTERVGAPPSAVVVAEDGSMLAGELLTGGEGLLVVRPMRDWPPAEYLWEFIDKRMARPPPKQPDRREEAHAAPSARPDEPPAAPAAEKPPPVSPAAVAEKQEPEESQPPASLAAVAEKQEPEESQPESWFASIPWRLGADVYYSFFLRWFSIGTVAEDVLLMYDDIMDRNEFFEISHQPGVSLFGEIWWLRLMFSYSTNQGLNLGDETFDELSFVIESKITRLWGKTHLMVRYEYDWAGLSKTVDRFIELSKASYTLRNHNLGVLMHSDDQMTHSTRYWFGFGLVSLYNSFERTFTDLERNTSNRQVRWFATDPVWPCMFSGQEAEYIGDRVRTGLGLREVFSFGVPYASHAGKIHHALSTLHEMTVRIWFTWHVVPYLDFSIETRGVIYGNQLWASGGKGFKFSEQRWSGRAMLSVIY